MKDFAYYGGEGLTFPARPRKPTTPKTQSSENIRRYADELEVYEGLFEDYVALRKEYYKILNARDIEFRNDLHSEYCPELTDAVFNVIFNKAWEDGHSSGHYRVAELVEELADFALEIMEKMK